MATSSWGALLSFGLGRLAFLLSIPWGLAIGHRLASGADSPGTRQA